MKKVVFFDIDDVLFKTNVFISSGLKSYQDYGGTETSVAKIKKLADIAVLSKGEYNLQLDKLKKTGLLSFFKKDDIFIVREKNEIVKSIFSKFEDRIIFVIDDRLDCLEKIKKNYPKIKAIWIKRGRYKNLSCAFKPDFIVDNLSQIIKVLR